MLYGLSLSIKSVIVFFLPCIIFGLLLKAAIGFARQASKTILTLLGAIVLSNFLSTTLGLSIGRLAYQFPLTMNFPGDLFGLQPAFVLTLPKWIGNDLAMGLAIAFGVILGRFRPKLASALCLPMEKITGFLLKGLLYVIPVFLLGFFLKMYHDRVIGSIVQNYGLVFALIACSSFAYLALLYWVASKRAKRSFLESTKAMFPAAITGFGSMSSAAAMPLTILGAEKNSPGVALSIIPVTVNVHLVGDCFAIPIFAFAVMKSFALLEPTFVSCLFFAFFFVLAKFSVAAVPGGGILVMLPILESYLGFDSTMLSLITALYILFDPLITAINILGNGAFAMHVGKSFRFQEKEASVH